MSFPTPLPTTPPSRASSDPDFDKPHDNLTETEILSKIHRLHLELDAVRGEDEDDEQLASSPGSKSYTRPENTPRRAPRLIVVSNRLPVTLAKVDGVWSSRVSSGGLVSALAGVQSKIPFVWVGWTGVEVSSTEQESLRESLAAENCFPVFLSDLDAKLYYNGFCNDVLWPLFHYVPLPIVSADGDRKFDYKYWEAYSKANHRFAEAVMQVYQPGDMVWVQDYHLMLLPSLLRKRLRDVTIGFFLHTPFPSSEVYRILPVRSKVLQGVLAADLIGFHTYDYARHFLSGCTRILGLEATPKGVTCKNHVANVGIFPIGIDPNNWIEALRTAEVKERIAELEDKFRGKKVLLGVDRLDYIKGVPHKLLAFEQLLAKYPEWKDKVLLVQIGVPSRTEVEEYKKLIAQVNELVGRINAQYGSVDDVPIVFINQSVNFHDLCALYTVADVAVVTSIRDGMNLVCYEYVVCQQERHGVLVLSEFAGSAQSLSSAIRINPWNIEELSTALHDALTVPERERALKHWKLLRYVTKHTAAFWARSFVTELQQIERLRHSQDVTKPTQSLLRVSVDVLPAMRMRKQRLFLLEYEGTLMQPSALPDLATPTSSLRRFLQRLANDPQNVVYIISGRSKETLDNWFGDLDIGLVSEHGCDVRHPTAQDWDTIIEAKEQSWRAGVNHILSYFTERTPGSHQEEKDKTVTWHYQDADHQFGEWQAKEVQSLLKDSTRNAPVETIAGTKCLEVRPLGVSLIAAVQHILVEHPHPDPIDFVFAIGSDKSHEDLCAYMNNYVRTGDGRVVTVTCRVGKHDTSAADRFVPDCTLGYRLLRDLAPPPPGVQKKTRPAGTPANPGGKKSAFTGRGRGLIQSLTSAQRSTSFDTFTPVAPRLRAERNGSPLPRMERRGRVDGPTIAERIRNDPRFRPPSHDST